MSVKRKGNAPAEATQELQALDVLELVETMKPPKAEVALPRKSLSSSSSIAPVGLDLAAERAGADEEANPTMQIRLPGRRRHLRGIVIGAIAGCALILVAAGIARVGHASSSVDGTASTTPPVATVTTVAATSAVAATSVPQAMTPPTATGSPVATSPTGPGNAASTGTVRLDRPALPGRVWLDGKKLSSTSAIVSCGTHQIKVGRGRTHSLDVPCGSEIGVSR
jgi:hypothetical protein